MGGFFFVIIILFFFIFFVFVASLELDFSITLWFLLFNLFAEAESRRVLVFGGLFKGPLNVLFATSANRIGNKVESWKTIMTLKIFLA